MHTNQKTLTHSFGNRSKRIYMAAGKRGFIIPREMTRAAFYETLSLLRYTARTGRGNAHDLTNYGRHSASPMDSINEFSPIA